MYEIERGEIWIWKGVFFLHVEKGEKKQEGGVLDREVHGEGVGRLHGVAREQYTNKCVLVPTS